MDIGHFALVCLIFDDIEHEKFLTLHRFFSFNIVITKKNVYILLSLSEQIKNFTYSIGNSQSIENAWKYSQCIENRNSKSTKVNYVSNGLVLPQNGNDDGTELL